MVSRETSCEVSSLRAKVDAAQRQMHEKAVAPLFVEQPEGGPVMLQSRGLFVNFELCDLIPCFMHNTFRAKTESTDPCTMRDHFVKAVVHSFIVAQQGLGLSCCSPRRL